MFGHQWIPQECNPYVVLGKPTGICNFKVKDLVNWTNREWRRPLVNQLFPMELAQKIFSIHIARDKIKDECYWSFSNNGKYTVKLGYFVAAKALFGELEENIRDRVWKKIWSLKLPPKFALFLWKVVHRILPVKVALGRRSLVDNTSCPVCGEDSETI